MCCSIFIKTDVQKGRKTSWWKSNKEAERKRRHISFCVLTDKKLENKQTKRVLAKHSTQQTSQITYMHKKMAALFVYKLYLVAASCKATIAITPIKKKSANATTQKEFAYLEWCSEIHMLIKVLLILHAFHCCMYKGKRRGHKSENDITKIKGCWHILCFFSL